MPKLLSLNTYNYRRGGSDVMFFEHDEMFRAQGWETAVMTMHHPKNEPSPWSEFFVDEIEFGHSYGLLKKIGMATKVIYSMEAREKLAKLLEIFRPNIAHVHCIYHHISPSVLPLLKERGIPTVLTSHDLKLACPNYKMVNSTGLCERCKEGNFFNAIRFRCVRNSLPVSTLIAVESAIHRLTGIYRNNLDKVVAPSKFMRDKLVEWGWDANRIAHIPNYVRSERFTPGFSPGNYFVYFGRLQMDKGIATTVTAAILAGVTLHVVGTGPDEEYVKELAANGKGKIQFHGYKHGEDLWKIVRSARATVLASEIYENAPMSILESYANGKPVIGARIGGIPEMIVEGETGWLFESGSVKELGEIFSRVQNMTNERIREVGENARIFVETNFSQQRYLSNMLKLYSSLGVEIHTTHLAI